MDHNPKSRVSFGCPDDGVDGIGGQSLDDAATVRSEREARRSDATRLRWRCDDPLDAATSARAVAHDYHHETGYPTQVIADEAQERERQKVKWL